ncbi:energy transducer TonB [Acinetobacter larvae]|uniref:TonB C-terminal domain-containing protein n=1 Tax=Acinetobacter larvae TaxID=1789224 RepID=A0A1B2LY72_9GAMM|nr:energy transducer TonB [Acinetobacter larvae]AOA57875.1 hypothetical protein BFG52_05585 [Acinetobacter larvae]
MNGSRRGFYQQAFLAHPVVYNAVVDPVQYVDPFRAQQSRMNQRIATVPRQKIAAAIALVVLAHTAIWYVAQQFPTQPLLDKKATPVVVEIVQPEPQQEPAKVIEPEVIKPKIPPVSTKAAVPAKPDKVPTSPRPAPSKVVTAAIDQSKAVATTNIAPARSATSPNTQPVAVAPASPAPAESLATQPNLPLTEAKGYAGYLSNPAPDYPEIALDRGWEGSVMLRVNVSAAGLPLSVSIKRGSGRKVLDDAAIRTVKRWKFSPAMRGATAIEGWVDVPIDYRLPR